MNAKKPYLRTAVYEKEVARVLLGLNVQSRLFKLYEFETRYMGIVCTSVKVRIFSYFPCIV